VFVRTTLERGEHSVIHSPLEYFGILEILPEENQAGTGTAESLVIVNLMSVFEQSRIGAQCTSWWKLHRNSRILDWVVQLLGSDEPIGVCNVCHEPGTFFFRDNLELGSGVHRCTTDDETGLET
jgi:hypothetical protein